MPPMCYLGLPLTRGRLSAMDWQLAMETMVSKLKGWQIRVLSKQEFWGGGPFSLSVVGAFCNSYFFICRSFSYLQASEKRLDGLMRRFFWKGWGTGKCKSLGWSLGMWSADLSSWEGGGFHHYKR